MAKSIEGLDKVTRNIDTAQKDIMKAAAAGMDYGLRGAVNHIKTEYSRPSTGKGFTDRTGNLRNSLAKKTEPGSDKVVGWVYATEEYAPQVELRWEGKYAYMLPGVKDKETDIKDAIGDAVKEALK